MKKVDYLQIFKTVLDKVEGQEKLSVGLLSDAAFMSSSHFQRLFRKIAGQPLMSYARGRRLAHSLNDLFRSDMRIIDIAYKYGFEHEQSYIRIFRKEFGCSPGEARKNKHILPIRESISPESLFNMNRGLMFGPEHVMVPSFHIVGKPTILKDFDDDRDALIPNMIGRETFYKVLAEVQNAVCPDVYMARCRELDNRDTEYMPGLEVKDMSCIPSGMEGWTFPAQHCVRFRYVGEHHYEEINMVTARETYETVGAFFSKQDRYAHRNYHFERIDTRLYDGVFCQMDLVIPVRDKNDTNGS